MKKVLEWRIRKLEQEKYTHAIHHHHTSSRTIWASGVFCQFHPILSQHRNKRYNKKRLKINSTLKPEEAYQGG